MVVPCDAKSIFTVADRFENTFSAQIEKPESLDGLKIFGCDTHAMDQHAYRSPKILWTFEARVLGRLCAGPIAHSHTFDHGSEVATLNGRIAYDHFGRFRAEHRLYRCADDRCMRDQAVHPPRAFILMKNQIRLHQHSSAFRNNLPEGTTFIGPSQRIAKPLDSLCYRVVALGPCGIGR